MEAAFLGEYQHSPRMGCNAAAPLPPLLSPGEKEGFACPSGPDPGRVPWSHPPAAAAAPAHAARPEGPGWGRHGAEPAPASVPGCAHRPGGSCTEPRRSRGCSGYGSQSWHSPPRFKRVRCLCQSLLPNLSVIRNPLIPHDWT